MKKTIRATVLIALLAASFASCNQMDMPAPVVPGRPVSAMEFTITTPNPRNVVSTKAMTDADETNIESLALFFFKEGSTGAADCIFVSGSDFSLSNPQVVTSTNYVYTVRLEDPEAITSGNWYIYAVANWNKSWCSVDLEALRSKSRAELDDLRIVKTSTSPNPNETAILLAGRYGEDNTGLAVIDPDDDGKATLTGRVHLRRFVSKINFRFNSGTGVSFTPERIFIYNYSRSATLFERSGWEQKNGTESYQYGTFSGSLTKAVAASGSIMSDATNAGLGYEVLHDSDGYYFTFYMPENIPTEKPEASITSYNDRDRCSYAADGTRTFINAPDDATYVVVTGSYSGPAIELDHDEQTAHNPDSSDKRVEGNVSYTIHLGNFSTTGANTMGCDDNFIVRRNSKYTYNVTVNGANSIAVEAAFDEERNPGAEGNLITTATGTTNIRLDSHYEQVIIAIPAGTFESYKLILETPYSARQIVTGRNDDLDVNWVKFAKPASQTEFRPYSQVLAGPMGNIFDLTDDLNDGNESDENNTYYIIGNDGKRYTAAYINEYYYDTPAGDVNDISLSKFINAPDRQLIFSSGVETSSDKHSSFTVTPIFSLRQRSIISPYDVDNVSNPFGIETVEETAATANFGGSNSANNDHHGWQNTTYDISLGSSDWSDYVNEAQNGHVNNADVPSGAVTTEGSKGIYQCLSRNRDLNGNGKIDSEEVRWYLPAMSQTNTIWFSDPFLTEEQKTDNLSRYYCSTYNLNTWWALEGPAYNNPSNKSASLVRCVRALVDYDQQTDDVWDITEDENGNTVFAITGLNEAAQRTDSHVGEYQPHQVRDKDNDMMPTGFVVAKDYVSQYETVITPGYTAGTETIASFASDDSKWHYEVENFNNEYQYVTVNMTLGATSPVQDIVSFGKPTTYSSWASNPVVHVYYPASNNAPSGQRGNNYVEICINGGHLAAPVTEGGEISVKFDGYKLTVISGSQTTEFDLPATFAQISELTIGSAEGNGRTYATDYSIELTTTADTEEKREEVVTARTFSQETITSTNLCSAYYYEKADRSDLGQWRIPNEKEFCVMYLAQKNGSGTFLKYESNAGTAARTQFNRTSEDGYSDTGMSYFYFNSGGNITTGLDSTRPAKCYVRCVRDASSGGSTLNSSDQNSMSNGGRLW